VGAAVKNCQNAKIKIFIMTGDHAITAQAIGKEIGLSENGENPLVINKQELDKINDEELSAIMQKNNTLIFSRVDPEDKLRIVKLLEENGEVVAVTGDGVNDAPALKKADIGVAMGETGTDVAKEASELILLDDSFLTLVQAVKEGRTIYSNLKKTVLASMTTNGAELVIVLLGLVSVALWNWSIPILAIQILAIDLLAEIMPLTFLTYDPPPKDLMNTPPRKQEEHILNKKTSIEVALLGVLIGALAFANFALFMLREGVTLTIGNENTILYARATTISFLTIAYCQFTNVMSRRYELSSIFNRNFLSNKILFWSIIASIGLVLISIYGPFISDFLSFAALKAIDWLYVLGAMGVFLAVFEIMKMFKRSKKKR